MEAIKIIEYLGVLVSIVFVILEVKQSIWLWPASILAALCSIYVFMQSDTPLVFSTAMQVYFLVAAIVGWIVWHRKSTSKEGDGKVKFLTSKAKIYMAVLLVLCIVVPWCFKAELGSALTLDLIVNVLCAVATILLMLKYAENWWILMLVNAISVYHYANQGLVPYSLLYLGFFGMSIYGYVEWRRSVV
ncbi:MAG: nicotinamide riboside transporter PnuC [Bacteroidales bacterium]